MKWAYFLTVLMGMLLCPIYAHSQDINKESNTEGSTSSYLLSKNNISIYPNPAIDDITIEFSDDQQTEFETVKMVNSLGNEVYFKVLNNNPQVIISITDFEGGVYFLHFENSDGDFLSKKIIIK